MFEAPKPSAPSTPPTADAARATALAEPNTLLTNALANEKLARDITAILKDSQHGTITQNQQKVVDALQTHLKLEVRFADGTTGADAFTLTARIHPGAFQSKILKALNNASTHNREGLAAMHSEMANLVRTPPAIVQPTTAPAAAVMPVITPPAVSPSAVPAPIAQTAPQAVHDKARQVATALFTANVADEIRDIPQYQWDSIRGDPRFVVAEQSIIANTSESLRHHIQLGTPESAARIINHISALQIQASVNPNSTLDATALFRGMDNAQLGGFSELLASKLKSFKP